MKTKILVLILLVAGSLASANEKGNGGGGVVANGKYMTFYSAGLYVEPMDNAQIPFELPAITKLFQYIASIPYLSLNSKSPFLAAILPTNTRQYMIATPDLLSPPIKLQLFAEYHRVTGVDPSNLTIYALTDTPQKITYILPGFDQLSMDDQMSILFHEAYWLIHPNASYNEVVGAEMSFEAALSHPDNTAIVYDFVKRVGSYTEGLQSMLKWEVSAGNLKGFTSKDGVFTLQQLLGDEYLACRKAHPVDSWPLHSDSDKCAPFFRNRLSILIAQYPKSMVLRDIASTFDSGGLVVGIPGDEEGCEDGAYATFNPNEETVFHPYANEQIIWDIAEDAENCRVSLIGDELNTACTSLHFQGVWEGAYISKTISCKPREGISLIHTVL